MSVVLAEPEFTIECRADPKCWGPIAWSQLDEVCNTIPCEDCREHCFRMLSFEHDLLNAAKGKEIFDLGNVRLHLESIDTFLRPLVR